MAFNETFVLCIDAEAVVKIIIPGGKGHVGTALSRELRKRGQEITFLSRSQPSEDTVLWDAKTVGD